MNSYLFTKKPAVNFKVGLKVFPDPEKCDIFEYFPNTMQYNFGFFHNFAKENVAIVSTIQSPRAFFLCFFPEMFQISDASPMTLL